MAADTPSPEGTEPEEIESLFAEAVWDGRGIVNTENGPVVGGEDW
ncbi:hypothetical protein [Streptomyces cyaneofuscatus]